MNDLFEIKKSKIAGNGIFASKEIKKGQTIYFLSGELCSLDEIIKKVNNGVEEPSDPLEVENEEYLDLDETSRTFNHLCNPNAFIRGRNELVALKNITIGEEITFDYSTTMNDNEEKIKAAGRTLWTCKCNCGAKNCRGIINQFKTLSKKRQEFYIKNMYVPDFILRKFK
ncbi:MAG: SET domain-containing protein [Nanoarchaeota archaeon]|nr:SET domain-containing protein [Nanoarchaeota archaeon]